MQSHFSHTNIEYFSLVAQHSDKKHIDNIATKQKFLQFHGHSIINNIA